MAAHSWRRGKDSLPCELELGGCHSSVTSASTSQEDTSPGVKECCREHWGCLSPLGISRRGEPAPEHLAAPALLDLLARMHLGVLVLQNCPSVSAVFGGERDGSPCESVSESPKLLWSCLLFTGV